LSKEVECTEEFLSKSSKKVFWQADRHQQAKAFLQLLGNINQGMAQVCIMVQGPVHAVLR